MENFLLWSLKGFSFFGGFLSLLIACGELCSPRKSLFQILFSMTLISIGFIQLTGLFLADFGFHMNSNLYFIYLPLLFLPAPIAYLTVKSLSDENFVWQPNYFLHGLPSLGIILIVFLFISFDINLNMERSLKERMIGIPLSFLYSLAAVYSFVYSGFIFSILSQVRTFWLRIFFSIFFLDFLLVSVLFLLGTLLHPFFFKLAFFVISLAMCLIYYIRRIHFDFPEKAQTELINAKYSRSRLLGMNTEFLLQKLNRILSEDKIYKNENLSLRLMAQEVSLTTHQLSELINQKLNKTFFGLINQYRIEDAKILLKATDKTVLEIALEVGFNNRSSFNEAFLKFSEATPLEYRKKNRSSYNSRRQGT